MTLWERDEGVELVIMVGVGVEVKVSMYIGGFPFMFAWSFPVRVCMEKLKSFKHY